MVKKSNLTLAILIGALVVSGCSSNDSAKPIKADIILLDISGSSTNSVGTYNSEDHSPSSLSQRKLQLEEKLRSALIQQTAIYFGFVHKSYGSTDIVTLVPSSLILEIDKILEEDVLNEKLDKQAKSAITLAWEKALDDERKIPGSCNNDEVKSKIINGSNAAITDQNAKRLSSKLCSNAANAMYQFNQLKGEPENIGSDIQGAIDRTLSKLASDEKRLFDSEMRQLIFIPRIILVSDLVQVTNGKAITEVLARVKDKEAACQLAKSESSTYISSYEGEVELISDGFAGSKQDIKNKERDKLRSYWTCWLESREIIELDIGSKGIDLGAL